MLTAAFVGLTLLAAAQDPKPEARPAMKTYQFVFFRSGPNKEPVPEAVASQRLQDHLKKLEDLWLIQGKAVLLGPLVESKTDIRGIVVLDTTAEDAKAIMGEDPFVKAGTMIVDIRPLMAASGIMQKPPKFLDLVPYTLGFYKRASPNLPKLSEEEGNKLMAAHLANNDKMRKAGALVWAGPFLDNTDIRGLLIFRETNLDKIREMIAEDALVKAGRLVGELHPALTAKGAFPPK